MTRFLSPLRYPGGKGRLAPYIADLISSQSLRPQEYAEPFAGGAGAALRLLFDEQVNEIHVNDLNPGIAAFWRCVFDHTEEFSHRVQHASVTMSDWHAAREVYLSDTRAEDIDLGYATFFLNRANRSGILNARPIGGLNQAGQWKIDARFNREDLSSRIRLIGAFRNRVHLTELDARHFLRELEQNDRDVLVYVDPPYLMQGDGLYLDSLTTKDHEELADQLRASRLRWFLTYDADTRITETLYEGQRCLEFDIAHTAQRQHVGIEYVVFSDTLSVPESDVMPGYPGRWVTA